MTESDIIGLVIRKGATLAIHTLAVAFKTDDPANAEDLCYAYPTAKDCTAGLEEIVREYLSETGEAASRLGLDFDDFDNMAAFLNKRGHTVLYNLSQPDLTDYVS